LADDVDLVFLFPTFFSVKQVIPEIVGQAEVGETTVFSDGEAPS